ncbi:peptidoglycan-binding domain-containing protein [Roseicyclus mahoneyensis]|uniref:Putative peptidoglycan binding protein n=1 Tax=Roseicyclus mahoneyensis TaxID=164332 RepID=A0A316GI73_9RHOB|nr:peptidoglycan-binding domain-containing protein [Roseicyclus mahoneyensis]PWK60713.1 putative peptidoglycan binding protein [Roseicyclus mahoneyensis]
MRHSLLLPGLLALTACMPAGDRSAFSQPLSAGEGAIEVMRGAGPPDADPSACYANESTPAVIETVTEQVMIQPPQIASDGRVLEPGVFVSESQQRIIRERRELWFQIPCEMQVGDPEFIASLQRALAARGLYQGPVTGEMTRRTERAIRAYQEPQGLDSTILSLAAAQQLGLSLWNPELAAGGGQG